MFAYCGNNPVNYVDPSGTSNTVPFSLDSMPNNLPWSDPLSGGAGYIVVLVGVACLYSRVTEKRGSLNNQNSQATNSPSGGAPSPQPPDNNEDKIHNSDPNYRGGSTYNKNGIRVDYEYYGNGQGNVHMHKKGINEKFYYDMKKGLLIDSSKAAASNSIQKLLGNREILRAIQKALQYING